jgi:hypothetical protein
MGFVDNKYVAKFIAGGGAPPLPPSHPPQTASSAPSWQSPLEPATSEPSLPPGWIQQWDPNTQCVYYLEQATGLAQWVPPAMPQTQHLDSSAASMMSGTTAHTTTPLIGKSAQPDGLKQHDVIRRNHVYLNLPTATEREEIRKKAEENKAREGKKPYVSKPSLYSCVNRGSGRQALDGSCFDTQVKQSSLLCGPEVNKADRTVKRNMYAYRRCVCQISVWSTSK